MDEEKKVSEILPPTEILAQMSEEFSEGAQAALKLRCALDGTNPTPKTIEECWENLKEEFGDVLNSIYALLGEPVNGFAMQEFYEECWEKAQEKYPRWKKRLSERKNVAVLGWPVCQNCGRPMVMCQQPEILAGVKYLHYCCPVCYNQSCSRKMLEPEEAQTND